MRLNSILRPFMLAILLGLLSGGTAMLVLPVGLLAQGGSTGAITGVVQDPSGAVIPDAKIVVISEATGLTARELKSTSAGTFWVTLLRPGKYRLEITAPGFAKCEALDVEVRVTETTNVITNLKLGQATETITVSEAAIPIRLSNATTGETITAHTVTNLPLSTGNFLTLLTLSSGANTEMFDSAALGRGQVSITVNGQRPANNNYQLEGINANDVNLPILDNVPLPNPNTIVEFKAQTSLYDASQGRNGGGNMQVNLKSGTNSYHGDVYGFYRDAALNANDWFLNRAGEPKAALHQNRFGGSFGGPVPRSRLTKDLYFFTNFQGVRAFSGAAAGTYFSTNIPVLPVDRSAANLTSIFFPSGLPPGYTQLDPVALAFLNLPSSKCPGFNDGKYCIPSLAGTPGFTSAGKLSLANITKSGQGHFSDDQFVISIDKELGDKDKLMGRWFWDNNASTQPFATASTLPFPMDLPGSNRFFKLGWTRTLSPTSVNDFRFGYNRFVFGKTPTEPISLSDIGATRGNSAQFPAAYRIGVSGAFSLGTAVNDDRGTTNNTFVYADDYSRTIGKHTIRAGGEVDRWQLNRFNNFSTRGSVAFGNTTADFGGFGEPALVGLQNFLLGRITTTQGGSGFYTFYFRATDYAGYVQDDWKATSRLTLNLGLRWEGMSTAHEKQNYLSNFQGWGDNQPGPLKIIHPAATPRVGTPGVASCTILHCLDANNIAPRGGFAYDLFGNHKTVLRGGYGIYYQRVSNQSLLQSSGGEPFSQAVSATPLSVTMQNPFPTIRPSSDFPLAFDQVVPKLIAFDGPTGAPVFQSGSGGPLSGFFFFPTRDFHAPYAQQWNFTVQRELARDWVLEVGYVGTKGVALLGPGRPVNAGQFCTTAQPCVIPSAIGAGVDVPVGTPFVTKNIDGTIAITGNTSDNIDARVPAQYIGLANSRGFFIENQGFSQYHSLQTTLSHHWSNGLYFQGAYTWSKSIDNGSGSSFSDEVNGSWQWGNLLSTQSNRGLADFDRTHRLVFSYNYELPFGRLFHVSNQGLGKIGHGWSINGVTIFQSGTPFVVVDSSALILQDTDGMNGTNFATLAPGATYASALTSGNVKDRIDNYLDLSKFQVGGNCVNDQNVMVSFADPSCTGYAAVGNVQRNAFRGPFQQNWDFSIMKSTKVTERVSIDVRAEAFNLLNHPAFQSPQGYGDFFGNYGVVDVSSGDTSILQTVNRPRILQFGLVVRF